MQADLWAYLPMSIIARKSKYYLVRRVPARYKDVEPRREIWLSLHTDSKQMAEQKAPAAWDELLEGWEARLAGNSDEAVTRYKAAREIARKRGFRYMPVEQVAKLPLREIVDRVDAAHDKRGRPVGAEVAALMGTVQEPKITVTQALDIFFAISKDRVRGKSEDQLRRWRNPRMKAVTNFVEVIGDLPMSEITPDDMLEFRSWWNDRIDAEGLTANSANKDLVHLASVLNAVNKGKGLNLTMPLSGYAIKDNEPRQRPGFSEEWIRDKILAPGALDGLNKDARCILLGMINTGYRPSEAECMDAHQIRLDTEIPHISIEPNGRTLKSAYAKRVIPLLGVSLEAFRECPEGFPQYRGSAGCSNTVNKFLTQNGLRETPAHSLYGLRHSFQVRMVRHGVDDRIRRDIFGHRLTEDRYGEIDLAVLRDALAPVAIK